MPVRVSGPLTNTTRLDVDLLHAFRQNVEEAAAEHRPTELARHLEALTRGYDAGHPPAALTPLEAAAYAVARAPGTAAAVRVVLREVARLRPGWEPRSLLDLGAGVGSATWAAAGVFGSLQDATLVERDPSMSGFGRRVAAQASRALVREARWLEADATDRPEGRFDLVVASYVLGELPTDDVPGIAARWFEATTGELVIVEVGSPQGFDRVLVARRALLEAGASITAPCPHHDACPMQGTDWCHFGVRVARSRLHRGVKAGERGFEDEKYSYVVASRQPAVAIGGRILRRPQHRRGHVRLDVCAPDGLREDIVPRSRTDDYRRARRAGWGDALPVTLTPDE